MELGSLVLAAGGLCGACGSIIALVVLIVKPIRNKFASWVMKTANTEEFNQQFDDINVKIDKLTELVEKTIMQNEKLQDESEKQSKALLSDTRKIILDMCNKVSDRGYMTMYESETLSSLYESYDALHGNTFVHGMVKKVFTDIPVKRNEGGE